MRPTIWFYGLPGSGKSTAASIACSLFGGPFLDSTAVRQHIAPTMGYSALETLKIAKTLAILSRELAKDEENYPGVAVFVCCSAPFEECRRAAIALNPEIRFVLMDTPLDVCKSRPSNEGAYGGDDQVSEIDDLPKPHLTLDGEASELSWVKPLRGLLGICPGTTP